MVLTGFYDGTFVDPWYMWYIGKESSTRGYNFVGEK